MLDIPKTNLVSTIELPNNNNLRIGMRKDKEKKATSPSKEVKEAPSMDWKELAIRACGEMCGTATLVFLGCISCVSSLGEGVNHLTICLAFGIAVLIVVQIFGHISGSHVNPAVTIAAFIIGHFKHFGLLPIYIISQCIGAIIGYALVVAATPSELFWKTDPVTNETLPPFCVTLPNPSISPWQGVLVEMLLTSILVWICGAIWDPRNKANTDSISIRFGLAIAGLATSGGFYSGASMNPARSLGPALVSGYWKHHWVYWLGPLSGSILAASSYRLLFAVAEPEPEYLEEIPLQTNSKRAHV